MLFLMGFLIGSEIRQSLFSSLSFFFFVFVGHRYWLSFIFYQPFIIAGKTLLRSCPAISRADSFYNASITIPRCLTVLAPLYCLVTLTFFYLAPLVNVFTSLLVYLIIFHRFDYFYGFFISPKTPDRASSLIARTLFFFLCAYPRTR